MNEINLEELAETSEKETENKVEKEKVNVEEEPKKSKEEEVYGDAQKILKLPFNVAMKNLNLTEDEVLEAGEKLFTEGNYNYEVKLPFNKKVVLHSKRVVDEADYYNFLYNAIEKRMNMEEFQYIVNIRNLAHCIVKFNDEDWSNMSFEEKYEKLIEMPSPLIASIMNNSAKFWSLMLIMLHKDFVGFLMKETQQ